MTPDQLVGRYQEQYATLRRRTVAGVLAAWAAYGGLDDQDSDRFTAAAARSVRGGQRALADLVATYLNMLTRQVTGGPGLGRRLDREQLTTDALRGVPFADVYHRPVVTARTILGRYGDLDQALQQARRRAEQLADTDMVMTQRSAIVQLVGEEERVVGYRRVLTGESCALCAAASTQRYHRGDLHPIHTHCDCAVAPIFGTADPGQVINSQLLDELNAAGGREYWKDRGFGVDENGVIRRRREVKVRERDGTERRTTELGERLRPAVREHGELGPVLTDPKDDFTGPDDVAA